MRQPPRVQVFASDINDAALNYARTGIYPSNIATDISDTRISGTFSVTATNASATSIGINGEFKDVKYF